ALRQAVAINPRHLQANLTLAATLLEKGTKSQEDPDGKGRGRRLLDQAIAAADRALAVQGDLAQAHLIRGKALDAVGRDEEALAALRRAVLTGPDLVGAPL